MNNSVQDMGLDVSQSTAFGTERTGQPQKYNVRCERGADITISRKIDEQDQATNPPKRQVF